jgi:hypothetical protein
MEVRPWKKETELTNLGEFDVGVMPLPDAAWERGKCGLKALQYMALGIPAVVSPVGINTSIVRHGENGLLASSEAEWENALASLVSDAALRRRLGRAGRETVERSYSARVHAPRVAGVFRHATAGSLARFAESRLAPR